MPKINAASTNKMSISVQAQLQQVQTPNGIITVAVLPQSLVSGQVQLQMQQLLQNQTAAKPDTPSPGPQEPKRPLKPKQGAGRRRPPAKKKPPPPPVPQAASSASSSRSSSPGEMAVQLSPGRKPIQTTEEQWGRGGSHSAPYPLDGIQPCPNKRLNARW